MSLTELWAPVSSQPCLLFRARPLHSRPLPREDSSGSHGDMVGGDSSWVRPHGLRACSGTLAGLTGECGVRPPAMLCCFLWRPSTSLTLPHGWRGKARHEKTLHWVSAQCPSCSFSFSSSIGRGPWSTGQHYPHAGWVSPPPLKLSENASKTHLEVWLPGNPKRSLANREDFPLFTQHNNVTSACLTREAHQQMTAP